MTMSIQPLIVRHESASSRLPEVDAILARLAERHSCREFDGTDIAAEEIGAIIEDGLQAPSSCNHQNWHFIAVDDGELKKRARAISGGNHHFEFCSVLIYLCFQKGWTHDKFSIVQSVSAACYHMMLSAHLRGYGTIWNAGIGDTTAIAEMLGIPPTFEIQGALCIGRPKPSAPAMKAPRRPRGEVWSINKFERPAHAIYPAKPAPAYPFFAISNARNPFSEWRPQVWGWNRIADFRGYAVWAKSPIADVYRSRRQGETITAEVGMVTPVGAGQRAVDVMPWGGTHTSELAKALPADVRLGVADLAEGNLIFTSERLRQEGIRQPLDCLLMQGPELPLPDASVDVVTLFQVLEHAPEPGRLLDEAARVLKPGGTAVITVRNMHSLFGWSFCRSLSREQVPNQGPFVPLGARAVRAMAAARFTIEQEAGISLGINGDGNIFPGLLRYVSRVYAMRVSKKAR
jgi:nitroreductase/ubiquinone/menaquinone biosynthesis C-methylase UbiE